MKSIHTHTKLKVEKNRMKEKRTFFNEYKTHTKRSTRTECYVQCADRRLMVARVSCWKAKNEKKRKRKMVAMEWETGGSHREYLTSEKRTVSTEARLWLHSRILWKTLRPQWNRLGIMRMMVMVRACFLHSVSDRDSLFLLLSSTLLLLSFLPSVQCFIRSLFFVVCYYGVLQN